MKIAMIGHKRIPSREGGVEIVVEQLATRLVKKGHQVDVYNRKGKNVQDENADINRTNLNEYKGIKIKTIPTINKKGLDALVYSFIATIKAIFKKYDVIHYHAEGPAAMLWIPHFLGIKTVVTIHGLDWQRAKWGGFAKRYLKFGEKIAAKYADKVIVLSKNVQKYFKDTYGKETEFIPNGIEKPENIEPDIIKKEYGLDKNDYILYLGRIVPEKGVHYLLKAFKEIQTDKKLVIAGGASHTAEYLENIKKLAAEDKRVIMTGFVQGKKLEELFSNCLAYCLPSDIEGMPLSLLEAMSYGKKCIVSNIPENMEVAGSYAISFNMGDTVDLKLKLEEVLADEVRLDADRIQEHILNICDWDAVVKKTENVYEGCKQKKKIIRIQDILFYIGVIFLGLEFWLSKVSIPYNTEILYGISIIALLASVNFKKYTYKDVVIGIVLAIISVISYYYTDSFTITKISAILLSLKERKVDNTIKAMLLVAIISSIFTIIPSVFFDKGNIFIEKNFGRGEIERRYCLGFAQPNNLHLIYIYIMSCLIYLKFDKIKIKHGIAFEIFNIILFFLTKSRTGLLIGTIILILNFAFKYIKVSNNRMLKILLQSLFVGIVIISILFVVMYGKVLELDGLDKALTGRIRFANSYFNKYNVNLFGNNLQIKSAFDFRNSKCIIKIWNNTLCPNYGGIIELNRKIR